MANKNVSLTVVKTNYDKDRKYATVYGHAYHVNYKVDGIEIKKVSGGSSDLTQYNVVDQALKSVLYRASTRYYTADVTINNATLPKSLQSFLKDKYETETQINSVTFA